MTAPVAPMEARCAVCGDTGMTPGSENLDCTAHYCTAAVERSVLNSQIHLARTEATLNYELSSFDPVWLAYQTGKAVTVAAPVAPQPATETVARFWNAVEARNHAPQPAMRTLPSTPDDVVEFLGSNIECMDAVGAVEDRRITLTVHDLLSAFLDLADSAEDNLAEVTKTEAEKNAATRRMLDAIAAQPAQQVEAVGQINQWRTCGCSDWYDGYPDDHDGGGPYETRTLYTAPTSNF